MTAKGDSVESGFQLKDSLVGSQMLFVAFGALYMIISVCDRIFGSTSFIDCCPQWSWVRSLW
jgi:hypothetical protein